MTDSRVLPEPELTEAELLDAVITVIDHVTAGAFTDLLEPDVPALSAGIVDSLAMAELVEALDDRFGVRLALSDLCYDTADSPRQIAALVASHRA